MKRRFTILSAALALLVSLAIPMGMRGQSIEINTENFTKPNSGSGYAAYDGTRTIGGVDITSSNVMVQSGNLQFKKSSGYLYNSTAIPGTITKITLATTTNFTIYVSTTANTETQSVTSGSAISGNYTYFKVKCGSSTGTTASITIEYSNGGPSTYTVTYDANGGTGTMTDSNSPYTAGATVTVMENAFTRDGFTFEKWNTAADGSGTDYDEDDTFTINANTTLYAQWTENGGGTGGDGTLTFDFEDDGAHRASGNNSYSNNSYEENGVDIDMTYFDAIQNSAIGGSYLARGRVAKNTTNSPVMIIGPIDITDKTITGITFKTQGPNTITEAFATSTDGTNYTNHLTFALTSTSTVEQKIVSNLGITGSELYLKWSGSVSSSTSSNRDFDVDDVVVTYIEASNPAVATTTTINVPSDFNTDIYQGSTAGTLTATVSAEGIPVSGATVTWSSSDTGVATIDANGAVTLVAVGTTTITANYAGVEDQYRPSMGTYELTVIDSSPLANIAALTAKTAGTYNVTLTDALVTYVNGTNAYLEDASGAVLLYHCAGTFAAGDKITGTANVTYTVYNNLPEVTAITLAAGYTLTSGNTVTPVVVTIAELNTNFNSYISRYVKIENATVTSAFSNKNCTIEQNGYSIVLRDQNSNATLTTTANSIVTVTAHPSIFSSTKQIAVYEQSQIVVSPTVYISADDVNITSSATSGSITYTIENEPSPAGTLTATVVAGYTISNLSLAAPSNGTIGFICDANTTTTARTAEITLVYTYGSKAQVTKTITVTQNAYVPTPSGGNYVRITSLDQLTDGSFVVIAARRNETNVNEYSAMPNTASGKPTGVNFISTISDAGEILSSSIANDDDNYYWVVSVNNGVYSFTNANGQMIGYPTSGTDFSTGQNAHTDWSIARETSEETAMIGNYTGFVIRNSNTNTRAFAFNGTEFGAYSTTANLNGSGYNFFLDFFVQTSAPAPETFTKTIGAYGTHGYYLISSPIGTVDPNNVTNMLTDPVFDEELNKYVNTYDLYRFDQAQELEWRNYRYNNFANAFDLTVGHGYLYGNLNEVELVFTGTAYNDDGKVTLTKVADEDLIPGLDFPDWNLVGNPFPTKAYIADQRSFYTMNSDGNEIIAINPEQHIEPMTGVFVVFKEGVETDAITFTTTKPTQTGESVTLDLRNGNNVIDRAIVRFDQGQQLPKFQLNRNSTKLYIPQDGKDYAVVCSEEMGAMPVNFKAEDNGTYTLNFSCKNVGFAYLHLIDNKTGNDIDLLKTPSYSFEAKTTDYESRFKLVFATGDNSNDNNFAFFSNGSFVINNEGNATLQVIDIMGRILSSETINGCTNVNVNAAPGVYMLRLVNGTDVKVQKVVVK